MRKLLRFGGEITGAFGDIGIFIPLSIALVKGCGIPHTWLFGVAAAAAFFGGVFYKVPMPVQPLKAMAAISLSLGLSQSVISSAALWMGGIMLLFSFIKKTPDFLSRAFPVQIIRGIQMGLGFLLIKAGFSLIFGGGEGKTMHAGADVFTAGFFYPLFVLVVPQIPLTLGNSVMATVDCAKTYFGGKASKVTEKNLLRDIGVFNVIAGIAGGFPICRGSGGVTAHYKFGARTGAAPVILGFFFLICALVPKQTLYTILGLLPSWSLGLCVAYIGVCHALLAKDRTVSELIMAALMGFIGLLTGNLTISLFAGWIYILLERKVVYAYR